MTRTLAIAAEYVARIRDAAARAHPNECCGLVEGVAGARGWQVVAIHETRNLAEDPARGFLIDPEAHFRLLRGLRGSDRAITGCFHSHPDGGAMPSERDRGSAIEEGFLWIIAAPDAVRAYVFIAAERRFDEVTLDQTG